MIMIRDAGAMRSSSHTGLRPMAHPTNTNVGCVVAVGMLRVKAAVVPSSERPMSPFPESCNG